MIGRLNGKLVVKSPPLVVIDCHGVGYEVLVSMNTYYPLPALGETTTLLTQQIVREDAHLLYGFSTSEEREAFRQLTKISGLGPKSALAILSGLTVQALADAVVQQEAAALVRLPGIGKKTAERMLMELKGKLVAAEAAERPGSPGTAGPRSDILQALLALGYSEKEAQQALKQLPADVNVSDGIRLALKSIGG